MNKEKPLSDLVASYGAKDITKAVEFVSVVPLMFPEASQFHVEKLENAIHVYGIGSGIGRDYSVGKMPRGMIFDGDTPIQEGRELKLMYGGVERVILHIKPYSGSGYDASPRQRASHAMKKKVTGSASRNSGEGRSGESRASYPSSGESRSAESAPSRSGESRRTGSSESGSGESRW